MSKGLIFDVLKWYVIDLESFGMRMMGDISARPLCISEWKFKGIRGATTDYWINV
jgi:hypothetical protein